MSSKENFRRPKEKSDFPNKTLVENGYARRIFDVPMKIFVVTMENPLFEAKSEKIRQKRLLAPLAEAQSAQGNSEIAVHTFFEALKIRKNDKIFFNRVLKYSSS